MAKQLCEHSAELTYHASSYCDPDNGWSIELASQHAPYCISGSCQLRLQGASVLCNVTEIRLADLLITGELQASSAHRQLLEMLYSHWAQTPASASCQLICTHCCGLCYHITAAGHSVEIWQKDHLSKMYVYIYSRKQKICCCVHSGTSREATSRHCDGSTVSVYGINICCRRLCCRLLSLCTHHSY